MPNSRPGITWLISGLLALCVALAFGRAVGFGFVDLDDDLYVRGNVHVLYGLSLDEITWAFTHVRASFWLPLVWISYMLDSQICGDWAGGFHMGNVVWHAATAIALFLTLRNLTGRLWPSAVAAALFALHPLQHEDGWVLISGNKR